MKVAQMFLQVFQIFPLCPMIGIGVQEAEITAIGLLPVCVSGLHPAIIVPLFVASREAKFFFANPLRHGACFAYLLRLGSREVRCNEGVKSREEYVFGRFVCAGRAEPLFRK